MVVIFPGKKLEHKAMCLAKCKLCGEVFWSFTDVPGWKSLYNKLEAHIIQKHRKIASKAIRDIQNYFEIRCFGVGSPERAAVSPYWISEQEYEELKYLAIASPQKFRQIALSMFRAGRVTRE